MRPCGKAGTELGLDPNASRVESPEKPGNRKEGYLRVGMENKIC